MNSWIIGRGKTCDIIVADPTVGRQHAELVSESKTHFVLIDRDSTNGTFVRRKGAWIRVTTSAVVNHDDRVRLGRHEASIAELMRHAKPRGDSRIKEAPGSPGRSAFERNPKTGEIIERRKG